MLRNTRHYYGLVAKFFHWSSAILIFILFLSGVWMMRLDYEHYWYDYATYYHENIGILFALSIILRLLWRYFTLTPELSVTLSSLEKHLAHLAHGLLYTLCITTIISGYFILAADHRDISLFSWFSMPPLPKFHSLQADLSGKAHKVLAWGLIILAIIHTVAACKHHFIDKDNTLRKIL
ncbi:MAG: cytochrome b [Cellvibrionaceae bacterium]